MCSYLLTIYYKLSVSSLKNFMNCICIKIQPLLDLDTSQNIDWKKFKVLQHVLNLNVVQIRDFPLQISIFSKYC